MCCVNVNNYMQFNNLQYKLSVSGRSRSLETTDQKKKKNYFNKPLTTRVYIMYL